VRQILGVTFRWAAAWTLLGLLLGVLLMIAQVEPFAESGAKPLGLSFYAFWIPLSGGAAGVFGFALGLLFSLLMALAAKWRNSSEIRPDAFDRYGARLLCGFVAGALLGLVFLRESYASIFIFAGLGFCSAGVSSIFIWRKLRTNQQKSLQGA
jgi:hypothetical protein